MIYAKPIAKRRWTPEDDKLLREWLDAGKTVTVTALKLKRTKGAVRARMSDLKIAARKNLRMSLSHERQQRRL